MKTMKPKTAKPISAEKAFPGINKQSGDQARYGVKLQRLAEAGTLGAERPDVQYSADRRIIVANIIVARDAGAVEERDAKLAELRALDAAFEEKEFYFLNNENEGE